jgi:hypothetical protein
LPQLLVDDIDDDHQDRLDEVDDDDSMIDGYIQLTDG